MGGLIRIRHPGSLKKVGYDPDKPTPIRRWALRRAVRKYGYAKVIQKLNAVRNLTRNSNPKYSRIYERDMRYLQRLHRKGRL